MKIVYIITRSDWGGAQANLFDLIQYAHRHAYECHLIVGEEGRLSEQVRTLGVPISLVPTLVQPIHPWKDMLATRAIIQRLREIKPDMVHLHSSKAGIVGRIAAHITGIPAIFTVHGWAFTEGVSPLRRAISLPLERWIAPWSKRMICVSEYDHQLALKYKVGHGEQLVTIHNGIPDVEARNRAVYKEWDKKLDPMRCVMVARFSSQKDYATLLHAASQVEVPLELNLVGQGELMDSMRHLVKELQLDRQAHFLASRSDIPDILVHNDLFVLTTNYEGFPISILEAMRAGLPVIASDVGGVREAVIDGVTGYLVPRGDIEAVRNRLEKLANDPGLRTRMGKAGRQRFLQHFTAQHMLERTFELYHEVQGSTGSMKKQQAFS